MKMRVWYDKVKGLITDLPKSATLVLFQVIDDDDEEVAIVGFDLVALPMAVRQQVSLYGLNKLLTDRTSGVKNKGDKLDAMQDYFELLKKGEWAKERVVGAPVVGVEVEALAEIEGISIAETQAALAQYDKETRKQILGGKPVQTKASELREARKDATPKSLDSYVS